jgi:murein DD-endopeptidase MepM/ murein hydrolase activator NlpD
VPIFTPAQARAGFFSSISSILGDDAYADTTNPGQIHSDQNSQTMPLLAANVTSASISENKDSKSDKKDSGEIDVNSDVNIVSDGAILPATGPSGVSGGQDKIDSASPPSTSIYVVRGGDTLSQIADMFGVSVNTILWANDMKKTDKIKEGDILFILPISGLEHTVTKGQTLQGIAKLYKADPGEIADFNGIAKDEPLVVGDKLMIPDAVKAEENDKPVKNLSQSIAKDKQYYVNHPIQNLAGYYIDPVPGYRKSQGIHDNNAVDLAIAKGTPILAAAEGRVILARAGYNGGFGNIIVISHPNGTETLYAHLSRIGTSTGASVYQGQVIGNVGSTGRSTGPHLHFEVHGARNPGADGSWTY